MNEADLAVTLGRIEEGIKHMTEKLDRLIVKTETHDTTLNKHEASLAVLESKSGSWKSVVPIVAVLVAGVALTLTVLDRLYA